MLPLVHRVFEHSAGLVGASPDELKLIVSFLFSYPLAGILKRMPDQHPERKNIFIISVSIFYLVGLFDLWGGVQTLAVSAAGIYTIACFLRTNPYMPWIGFLFAMTHMSVSQIIRQMAGDPSSVDVTGAQMVLVMKLSAFCWNVHDGQLPDEHKTDFQRDRSLRELPSLLDYTAYVLFFPSLFAGPAFDFAEYRRWIDTSMFQVGPEVEPSKKPPSRKKRKIPRSGGPAAVKAASGLLWIGLFIFLSGSFDHSILMKDSFTQYGFLRRIWILHMVGFTARLKYYGVWALAEGACILTGLGYNGLDLATGKVSWDRLQNVDPWAVETAQNSRAYLGGWNMNTNNWLRNYVYLRVTPKGKKPGFRASMTTFATSALWHGFYPGYYLSFVLASLIQTVAKNFRRHLRPFFLDPITGQPTSKKIYYDCLSYLATQVTFDFVTAPFLILGLSNSLEVWRRMYFYVVIGTVVSMAFFASPAKDSIQKQLDDRQKRAGVKMVRNLSQESLSGGAPVLGVSVDPERDISEVVDEIKGELEKKRA